jgi:hypothetical protein
MRRNGRHRRADGGCGVEHAHAAVPAAAVPAPRRHSQPRCMAAWWGSQQRFGDKVVDDAGDLLLVLQIREDGAGGGRCSADVPHAHTPVPTATDDLRSLACEARWGCGAAGAAHVLRMNFAPAAVEHGVVSGKHRLQRRG